MVVLTFCKNKQMVVLPQKRPFFLADSKKEKVT